MTVRRLLNTTSVILLANPAHNTALNTRKRLILSGHIDREHELSFTGALLTEHQASKSSLLWHHRRWLIRQLYPSQIDSVDPDALKGHAIPDSVIGNELAATGRAAEVYARNYFAWRHRVLCTSALIVDSDIVDQLYVIRSWIDLHIADFSSVHYCCGVLALILERNIARVEEHAAAIFRHALELTRAYPLHENAWLYLRLVASILHYCNTRVQDWSRECQSFAEEFGAVDSSKPTPFMQGQSDAQRAAVHASRFVAWCRIRLA